MTRLMHTATRERPEDGRSREFTKLQIRAGVLVDGPRGCEKTRCLLEVVHEDLRGRAVIVCAGLIEARVYRARYREMFPREQPPRFITAGNPASLEGLRDVFVDGFSRFNRHAQHLLRMGGVVRGVG